MPSHHGVLSIDKATFVNIVFFLTASIILGFVLMFVLGATARESALRVDRFESTFGI